MKRSLVALVHVLGIGHGTQRNGCFQKLWGPNLGVLNYDKDHSILVSFLNPWFLETLKSRGFMVPPQELGDDAEEAICQEEQAEEEEEASAGPCFIEPKKQLL